MARLFLTNIDLKGNQLVNVVLHNNSSATGLSTTQGSMYYDTTTFKFQFRQGPATGSWVGYQLDTTTLSGIPLAAANVDLNAKKITNLLDPTDAQDAATKAYVDGVAQGLDVKPSVRVASTTNLASFIGVGTAIDGVTLAHGERVLLKNQNTASENGIWVTSGGTCHEQLTGLLESLLLVRLYLLKRVL